MNENVKAVVGGKGIYIFQGKSFHVCVVCEGRLEKD